MTSLRNFPIAAIAGGALLLGAAGCSKDAGLERFESCDELEEYIEDLVIDRMTYVEPYTGPPPLFLFGIPGGIPVFPAAPMADMSMEGGDDDDASGGGSSYSQTNVQEQGVDEADFVKNDGEFLYTLNGQRLVIVDAWPATEMHEVSSAAVEGHPLSLYLAGDTVAVLSGLFSEGQPEDEGALGFGNDITKITVFDVTDRAAPRMTREVYVEGTLWDSRRVAERLYLITYRDLAASDGIDNLWGEDKSTVKETVRARSLDQWLPRRAVNTRSGSSWSLNVDRSCGCTDIYKPAQDGGTELMSVLSLDILDPESEVAGTSVLAGLGQVYASAESLYLAVLEPTWGPWKVSNPDKVGTRIHKFDIDGAPEHPVYEASGRVDGWVLNSFSMDEQDRHFRLATTRETGQDRIPVNAVYVMRQVGEQLDVVGQTEDIAPDEDIFAVRFIGDVGYVVTFHRVEFIDPLFTIDLSDPANPTVMGELKVPGYSTYLHPMDDEHLLAVGEDTDEFGWVTGVQFSLFDVGDLENPQLQDSVSIGTDWAASEAVVDHHAFQYYAPLDLFAVPVTYEKELGGGEIDFAGLQIYEVTVEDGFTLVGEMDATPLIDPLVDPGYSHLCSQIRRSIIIEDKVFGVASGGIVAAPADAPTHTLALLAFPDAGNCDDPWNWTMGMQQGW